VKNTGHSGTDPGKLERAIQKKIRKKGGSQESVRKEKGESGHPLTQHPIASKSTSDTGLRPINLMWVKALGSFSL